MYHWWHLIKNFMNIVIPNLAFWWAWDCECSGANGECWNIGTKLTSQGGEKKRDCNILEAIILSYLHMANGM